MINSNNGLLATNNKWQRNKKNKVINVQQQRQSDVA